MKRGTKFLMWVLVSALVLGIAACAGMFYARDHVVLFQGKPTFREAKQLSLRGKPLEDLDQLAQFPQLRTLDARGSGLTAEEYHELFRSYPRVQVLWDVPFQNGTVASDAEKITVTTLNAQDIQDLRYLKNLKSIDAWNCEDYDALTKLQEERPDCKVFYSVSFGAQEFDCDIQDIFLVEADGMTLVENLQYLPMVTKVTMTGPLPVWEELDQAMTKYPFIEFNWEVFAFQQTLPSNAEELVLTDDQIETVSELEEVLPYLPKLKTVDLRSCDLPGEELVDLAYQWPEIDFLFGLTIGHVTVCTDAKEIDISNHIFENTDQVERYVNCFPNLQKVIMCECGISNEEMDALNRKYEDIRFVWSVQLGVKLFRTDSLYYTPNKWGEKCFDETIYNLRYCTDMVCVDIGHMKDVSNCEWAAFMPNLKYLILAQTAIRDLTPLSGLKNLVFLELFQSKARDYSPLVSITSLEDLNLSYTFGDPEPISQMTWLKRLWWSGSWIARTTLPEVLTETEMEFYEVSSTGGTWREGQNYYDMRDLIGMDYMSG